MYQFFKNRNLNGMENLQIFPNLLHLENSIIIASIHYGDTDLSLESFLKD